MKTLKPELDFNFADLEVVPNQSEAKPQSTETAPSLDFSFELSQEQVEEKAPIEKTEFSFDTVAPAAVVEPKVEFTPAPAQASASHDPLMQSFPDLQHWMKHS